MKRNAVKKAGKAPIIIQDPVKALISPTTESR